MSRKRRLFDIEMPEDGAAPAAPEAGPAPQRRGPMASAIAENAEALQARKTAADAIRAENDALAHEFVALREAGHIVQSLPLDAIRMRMLARERLERDDMEMAELVASIRDLGLSNPIRVMEVPGTAEFELVQGFRRLGAYRALLAETGDEAWARIPALVLDYSKDVAGMYRRMVDENVVRKDLSFAEMANAAQNYALDPQTGAQDLAEAIAALYPAAPYSKRSYIRAFAQLLDTLGPHLIFPTEIPRSLGVALAREIKERPEIVGRIRDELRDWDYRSVADELGVLKKHVTADEFGDVAEAPVIRKAAPKAGQGPRTKTTFHMRSTAGQVKCTAGQGRLEIKVDRDFSAIDRARLEALIASLIDGIG